MSRVQIAVWWIFIAPLSDEIESCFRPLDDMSLARPGHGDRDTLRTELPTFC